MNQTPNSPAYEHFQQLLTDIELVVGASEIHGVICGLLCAGQSAAHLDWIESLFAGYAADDLLVQEARQLLAQLYTATREEIGDAELDFSPYLPGDDVSLAGRAKSLSEWCQGYLYGLGLAGIGEQTMQGNAREAVVDLSEITKLDYANVEEDETSEAAYMELVEFLRVATLLIWEELSTVRESVNES